MGEHNKHLPRNDDNKRFDDSSLDRKAARNLVNKQGRLTKEDAKAAVQRAPRNNGGKARG